MIIEKMKKEHIKKIAELECLCFSEPWSESSLKNELDNTDAEFFVCCNEDELLGYMGMHIILDECYVTNIAVFPIHRNKGVGNALVKHCCTTAYNKGCSFISLEVRVSNKKAIALYEKNGFVKVGERKNFYSHPTENGLIMTKELK